MNSTRYQRAQAIAFSGIVRKVVGSVLWKVESQAKPGFFYNVIERPDGLTCDCPDFEIRQEVCKHCWAVIISTAGVEEK